jgi:hypothetical protein
MIMSNSLHQAGTATNFLAETYKGRRIATFRHSLGWHIYLDNVMQANRLFASSEDAFHWLRRKVDDAAFDNRIAMLCKRHSLRRPSLSRAAA